MELTLSPTATDKFQDGLHEPSSILDGRLHRRVKLNEIVTESS